ncbi:M20 family peptidase [Neobacillus notoginsengisoli]|uniref:M20 family peptidase n=1 Tax=Neobacillus notoginsengisoli TaxID=1578198 RepID=A0A417YK43_9BACI|nr:M20/M25/M40 family metallo-hydrolase [Neobacillus notoginsengisoli]RHW33355.1 M20 family peptidase [Neobacillus notoginsengisoli]
MVIDLLKNLISIDSSTIIGGNIAVDFCGKWLAEQGLEVSFFENNGYRMLVSEIGEGDSTLVLNGHVDVVAGSPRQFTPMEEGGRLYGRGSADMKAGVAAMMATFAKLTSRKLGCKLQLQIVSDEEIGGMNCTGFLVENGYRGDFVICAEPTGLGIANQAKGILRVDITAYGKAAHGSRPWEGVNAIEVAYDVYRQVLDLPFAKESSEYYQSPSINLAKIEAGNAYNVVPDECRMGFDIRYLPGQNHEEILRQIGSINGIEVVPGLHAEPIHTARSHPFLLGLADIVSRQTGEEAVFFGQHGSADTVFFAKYGIPAIEFGPDGDNWHGEDEYVDINSVLQFEKILIELACSGKIT